MITYAGTWKHSKRKWDVVQVSSTVKLFKQFLLRWGRTKSRKVYKYNFRSHRCLKTMGWYGYPRLDREQSGRGPIVIRILWKWTGCM